MGKIITLTTDFGTRDPFVGAMKGVILSLCPGAEVVDITHEVTPFHIMEGALALASACHYYPKGTIHLAVVDPGVGTKRKAIAVRAGNYFFVGPDNGILSLALAGDKRYHAVEIRNPNYRSKAVSSTFHGRDVFAPAAAHLAKGVPLARLGPEVKVLRTLALPQVRKTKHGLEGQVIAFDRFGNAVTNIRRQKAEGSKQKAIKIIQAQGKTIGLADTYGDVKPGEPLALWGSHGFLEIAVNRGDAERNLKLRTGVQVLLEEKLR